MRHLFAQAECLASRVGHDPLFESPTMNRSLAKKERKLKGGSSKASGGAVVLQPYSREMGT